MKDVFRISGDVEILPVWHGSGMFMREVRQRILESGCDCLAVCLPPEFRTTVEDGLHKLPYITVSALQEDETSLSLVPVDPTQPVIAGLRIAQQENIRREYIDLPLQRYEPRKVEFPDPYALREMSLERFAVTLLPWIKKPAPESQHDHRVRWMAYQLHRLELECHRIVMICSLLDWPWIKAAYDARLSYPSPGTLPHSPVLYGVEESHLFFALSEFPYVTYLYEKRREELRADQTVLVDGVKEVLVKARQEFLARNKSRAMSLNVQAFQVLLRYVRNLTLLEHRLTPDLYTLATAAKQVGGDGFAISLVEAARKYPYQNQETGLETLELGVDKAVLGGEGVLEIKNRLNESNFVWRSLDLKPEPEISKQEDWKYAWDPYGQCSWPPEDDKIESFNTHVREQSKLLLANDLARSEKFTASVKDGVDIRETLRHWYSGDLYVKEIPASRGKVEIVVFLFEMEPEPDRYPWRQTWYAEHTEESTLCFYATNYLSEMIGPGIGQASYGGCMMLYPPRPIPNIWEDPRLKHSQTLEEKLLEAAFFHSMERHVTVVSPAPPLLTWRKLARRYQRRIIHIPLNRFSSQTLERVRCFHVLNGKEVRSFAQRFIRDP